MQTWEERRPVWEKEGSLPAFPKLKGDLKTDVLVIGGGLAGLLCTRALTRAGVDCVCIEENRIMDGVSGRTTAKLTAQHGLVYSRLLKTLGQERAGLYWQANRQAVAELAKIAKQADCGFETKSHYLFAQSDTRLLEQELAAYEKLKIPARWKDALPLPFPVAGAVGFPDQGQFHPRLLAAYLAKDLNIYENTKALAFLGDRVQTPHGTVCAKKIVVATHFPLWNKHGAYFLKLYQQRSYVLALENAGSAQDMYLDCRENGLSVRVAGPWLLLGGGGHRTGKQGLGWQLAEQVAEKYYPQGKAVARWATQDCMTLDAVPYIGRYSRSTPNLYVATGFQKWGMSSSMVAATVLADLVQEKENPYGELFSPSRSMVRKQLLVNGVESAANLLRPTVPRCPHLGCALRWNKQERSWDCPCHGSRFDELGNRLNGPATDGLKHPPL